MGLHFFYKKIYKKKKIVIIFFSIIPPNLALIIILLFFTKHMAYNINFCEGNLEAVSARFWCSLKNKTKTLTVCTPYPTPTLIWQKKITTLLLIHQNTIGNKNYS